MKYKIYNKLKRQIYSLKSVNSILILALVFFLISGCEYKNDKIYFREIETDVSPPDLNISLNLSEDTIYVYNYSKIEFSLSLTNKELYDVIFYINDIQVESVQRYGEYSFNFYVDISRYSIAKIRAEIYTSTETNSIADVVGAEAFIYKTAEWTLIRCEDDLKVNTLIEDGRLKILWTPIRSKLERKYIITSSEHRDSTDFNWYIDSNYIGGKNYISVRYDDNEISGFGVYDDINYEFPKAYINNKDSFLINWDRSDFYNSIRGYMLIINSDTIILNPNDTSYAYKDGLFGSNSFISLYLLPNNDDADNYYIYSKSAFYPLSFFEDYVNLKHPYFPLNGTSFYYWSYDDKNQIQISKFNIDSKTIINSKAISSSQFTVSPNDIYILVEEDDYINLLNSNLEQLNSILKTDISSNASYRDLSISDNAHTVIYDYVKESLVVCNLLTGSIVAEIPVSEYTYNVKISANGNYIFDSKSSTLYKVEDGSYSVINTGVVHFSYYEFFQDNNTEQIALYDESTLYLRNCSDYSKEESFSLDNTTLVNIDYQNEKILTYKDNDFYIYSLNNGSVLDTVPSKYVGSSYIFDNYILQRFSQYNLNY